MVDVRRDSKLGMVLPSRRVALPGPFCAEREAILGLEAPYSSDQRKGTFMIANFFPCSLTARLKIGRKVWIGDDILLFLLLLEAPRYVCPNCSMILHVRTSHHLSEDPHAGASYIFWCFTASAYAIYGCAWASLFLWCMFDSHMITWVSLGRVDGLVHV